MTRNNSEPGNNPEPATPGEHPKKQQRKQQGVQKLKGKVCHQNRQPARVLDTMPATPTAPVAIDSVSIPAASVALDPLMAVSSAPVAPTAPAQSVVVSAAATQSVDASAAVVQANTAPAAIAQSDVAPIAVPQANGKNRGGL
ncbi:hypothetical protein GGH91_002743 [Coemansia sp. RSA 2671]|nr:hypothetical protein GGH91_002743 [Coemansia sp. RSA 2671]